MSLLLINQDEVRQLLTVESCIPLMEQALKTLARGEAIMPLRPVMWLPENFGALAMMPSYLGDLDAMGLKVISYFPENMGTPYDTHQGAVFVYETRNGRLLAIVDATEITAIRTPAVTAVATDLLARPDCTRLGLLGSGTQARGHLAAMLAVRPIEEVRVWSIDHEGDLAFAARARERHGIEVQAVGSAQEAVEEADLICTTTSAPEPILFGKWLKPGVHLNAVGSTVPHTRELDTEAVLRARMYVDNREAALEEAGDFRFPRAEGAIGDDHIVGEIGALLLGSIEGRRSEDEITLYKSLGLAIEDLAAAHYVYQQALEKGIGTSVPFGGRRHD